MLNQLVNLVGSGDLQIFKAALKAAPIDPISAQHPQSVSLCCWTDSKFFFTILLFAFRVICYCTQSAKMVRSMQ